MSSLGQRLDIHMQNGGSKAFGLSVGWGSHPPLTPSPWRSTSRPLLQELNCVGQGGFCPFPKPIQLEVSFRNGTNHSRDEKMGKCGEQRTMWLTHWAVHPPQPLGNLALVVRGRLLGGSGTSTHRSRKTPRSCTPPKMRGLYL